VNEATSIQVLNIGGLIAGDCSDSESFSCFLNALTPYLS